MRIHFNEEERNYIVDNPETDLLLTAVGMRLVDGSKASSAGISVEASEAESQEFIEELREEFARKIQRVTQPSILRGLARRLLPGSDDIALE